MSVRAGDDGAAIVTEGLTRRFGRAAAVDGVSMRAPRGSVYAFLGPNGAGKTTTIRMLLGLIRPSAGAARVLGRDVRRERREALARIGSLVEGPSVYGHLTGAEHLRAMARLTGAGRERIPACLARVGLGEVGRKKARHYSLGMKQRLGLAMAMLHEPEALVLDEPTNGLDPAGVRELRDLFGELAAEGRTVFVSSHLLAEVEQVATHVGVIVGGRLVFEGETGALTRRMRGALEIEVDDAVLARRVIGGMGLGTDGEGALVRVSGDGVNAAAVNAALVSAGVRVSRLGATRPSLEEAFFSLTGGAGEGAGGA